jgi:hypothetical protein
MKLLFSAALVTLAILSGVQPASAQKGKTSGGTTTTTSSQTAQSVSMFPQVSGQFLVKTDRTYAFDPMTKWAGDSNTDGFGIPSGLMAPVDYYTNTAVACTQSGQTGTITVNSTVVCYKTSGSGTTPSATQLSANIANAAEFAALADAVGAFIEGPKRDWEKFADGGLSDTLSSTTYTRTLRVATSGYKTVDYTWQFKVEPIANLMIEPLTGWYLIEEDGDGTALVNVNGIVSGESLMIDKNGVKKYSFSLLDADGVTSRVTGLTAYVVNAEGIVESSQQMVHSIVSGNDLDSLGQPIGDFTHQAVATSGSSTTAIAALQNGDARTILKTDGFLGNNDGGVGGQALQHAEIHATVHLPPGDYTVTVSGSIKSVNSTSTALAFKIGQVVNVISRIN